MIYKYVWQNIDNEDVVIQDKLVKESFAHYFSDLHDELCEKVPRVDWDHPELQLAKLIDNVPFDDSLIALPSVRREQQRAQTTPIEVDQD
ncbi:hypothetical protein [Parasitella parasitica]|uniref:Uncharacterized protein n=1 Tax=Parasitella parasitica TaxID=35722 RepID=A0A0B7NPB8_9FUNG|nr:hypothetical protein [Parasitella parasitica]